MSSIDAKIKAEVALETEEISKTAMYLPPLHKHKQYPYIQHQEIRSLSPKAGKQFFSPGLSEKDEFERQKQSLLKKYNFPSNFPIMKSPREMQEPYAFMAQQLMISNETSANSKQRAKHKLKKGALGVNIGQVLKDAETLLQTAKLALRQSRLHVQEASAVSPVRHSTHHERSSSPSYKNPSPKASSSSSTFRQHSDQLSNSPETTLAKLSQTMPNQQKKILTDNFSSPTIRIFKAELAPLPRISTKNQTPGPKSQKETSAAKQETPGDVAKQGIPGENVAPESAFDSKVSMKKIMMEIEKPSVLTN
jgi:hypothetical protein